MKEETQNPLITFLSTKTGLSATALTTVVTVAGPFISHQLTYQKAFSDGSDAYQDALREGTAELDGEIIEIITDAQRDALEDLERIQGEADVAQAAQDALAFQLAEKDRLHAQTIAALAGRTFTPQQLSWRATPVPDATRLRLNTAIAAREGGDGERGLPAPLDLAGPADD